MFIENRIDNEIVRMLANKEKCSIPEILTEVNKQEQKISKAQLYKIVNKLLDNHVLIKEYGHLKINELWLLKLERFLATARGGLEATVAHGEHILQDGESKMYYADTMKETDRKRSDIAAKVASINQHKNIYSYAPHLYHVLGDTTLELGTLHYLLNNGGHIYDIIKGDSFLDKYAIDMVQSSNLKNNISTKLVGDDPFIPDESTLEVVGDYIIETFVPEVLRNYFKQFYATVHNIEEFHSELFVSIFSIKADCRIKVTRDAKKAAELKAKIESYFKK